MTIDMNPTPYRRAVRASVVALGLGLGLVATPALAAPPQTWEEADNGSILFNLLVYGGIPLGTFLLVALLVYLPSMMRGESSEVAFQERPEWFGGPRAGVDAAADGAADGAEAPMKGGAGGQW